MAVLAAAGVLAGCTAAETHATGSASRSHRSTSPPTTGPGAAVTLTVLPLVDTSRPVVGDGQVLASQRNLPTFVWTPDGPGPFPLVVFAHGYDVGPLTYERFCAALAARGYVVAAPSFPQEDPARGFPLDETHLGDEAGDVSFVVASIERDASAKVDPARVAVVGQSDGADVALLVGYGSGTVDPRVGAVVADSPDPMTVPPVPSRIPLLLVQGTADSVVPYSSSQTVFAQIPAPVFYLSLLGADHQPPIIGGTPWTPVLDAAVSDFLDGTVAGRGSGNAALDAELSTSSLVQFRTKG